MLFMWNRFVYVDIGANGRVSDGGVWRNCALAQTLSSNDLNLPDLPLPNTSITAPMVIVADEAFPLKSYLMKPYPRYVKGNYEIVFHVACPLLNIVM